MLEKSTSVLSQQTAHQALHPQDLKIGETLWKSALKIVKQMLPPIFAPSASRRRCGQASRRSKTLGIAEVKAHGSALRKPQRKASPLPLAQRMAVLRKAKRKRELPKHYPIWDRPCETGHSVLSDQWGRSL